jgi:hypothetical protein
MRKRAETSRNKLAAALQALETAGIPFRGPFASSRGDLIQVEDTILRTSELVELFAKGQLSAQGIRAFVWAQELSEK